MILKSLKMQVILKSVFLRILNLNSLILDDIVGLWVEVIHLLMLAFNQPSIWMRYSNIYWNNPQIFETNFISMQIRWHDKHKKLQCTQCNKMQVCIAIKFVSAICGSLQMWTEVLTYVEDWSSAYYIVSKGALIYMNSFA